MFRGRPARSHSESFSKSHGGISKSKRSFRDHAVSKSRLEKSFRAAPVAESPLIESALTSSIVTLVVGREQRLFAAHEDLLCLSPFFQVACRGHHTQPENKRIVLPDEEPEVFSSILEYLYKGDYTPRLVHDKQRNSWSLDSDGRGQVESTVYHYAMNGQVLKDTMIYCTAEKYGLEELKRVALRKQGLQSGVQCSTILTSARFAYAYTPETDSKLRAHYLALIIRSRSTFKRSGTMQMEMLAGGSRLFFDLFVALCNHVDDISNLASSSPRSIRTLP